MGVAAGQILVSKEPPKGFKPPDPDGWVYVGSAEDEDEQGWVPVTAVLYLAPKVCIHDFNIVFFFESCTRFFSFKYLK